MEQPAWYKNNEVFKTDEISKTKEINKYSDCSNFWGLLFGDYEIYPGINQEVAYKKRKIGLDYQERLINIDYDVRKISLTYE